ncbi:MAG: MCE family protein, partial [Acidobacteriota bacterium]|nr:MCE family protein [Acidobacteriota bacterium]
MKIETKVGLFFVGTLVVLGILIFNTGKFTFGGDGDSEHYMAYFDQVAGLAVQAPVRVAGVKVGEVKTITLDHGRAKVALKLDKGFPVYADSQASLSSIGILGEKYIDITQGHYEKGLLDPSMPIASRSGVSLDDLMVTLAAISRDIKGVTGALSHSIGGEEGQAKLDEIVDNIRVLTGEFRTLSQENHAAINNTLANAEAMTGDLRERMPRLAQQFEDLGKHLDALVQETRPELRGTMQDVHKLASSFQETSVNLKSITAKLNNGEGTIGKLLNDDSTIKKINTAVDSLNDMLGGVKSMDLRLDMNGARWNSRGDSQVGLGIELAPRHDYWYALDLNATPDGKISDSTRTVQKIDPTTGLPVTVLEKTRTVTSDQALTVSAQFAKRFAENWVLSAG